MAVSPPTHLGQQNGQDSTQELQYSRVTTKRLGQEQNRVYQD